MTVASVERKARRILQDRTAPYRWDAAEIRDALQEGVAALNAVRPATRYLEDGSLVDCIELPQSDTAEISIDSRYEEALVYFVVHKCYLDDAADTVNAQLSELYLGKFNTKSQL